MNRVIDRTIPAGPLGMLQRGEGPRASGVAPLAARDPARARRRRIRCAACGHEITTADTRVSVDGAHVHTRTNPDGQTFTFGCFAAAPGCVAAGAPSLQATWFPGHFWWIELCGGCRAHVGWQFFADGGGDFHGLVLDRVCEVEV